jgi:beta-xylosidase
MKHLFFILAILSIFAGNALAIDNGDGTYSNPMINADYPDSDIIRVGGDFYYLSSSFHFIPGDPVMHSRDLVNWKPVGFTIPDYKFDDGYKLDGTGTRYGRGSWAPSIRYNNGTYYAVCNVFQDGNKGSVAIISRATNPSGPWKTNLIPGGLYDPGLFFDDDGKVYVINGNSNINVTELDADLTKVVTPAKVIYSAGSMEGSHAYKINGMYYIYGTSGGVQQCLRSKSIYGPYEHKTVFTSSGNYPGTFIHQGGLVQLENGDWWTVLFQDRGKHGRIPFLLPVKWQDGWPIPQFVMTCKKPNVGGKAQKIDEGWRSDSFNSSKIGLQWQWNHQPNDANWSLSERKGWLRLHTTRVVDNLRAAQNTLTQRIFAPDSGGIAKLDVSNLKDGDYAGVGVFSAYCSYIGVTSVNGVKHIALVEEVRDESDDDDSLPPWMRSRNVPLIKKELATAKLESDTVWLKVEVPHLEYAVNYYYSLDGKNFTKLGEPLGMPNEFFTDWMGSRYCIFNYASKQVGGSVDFDSFDYITPKRQNNLYKFGDIIDAQFCDDIDVPENCRFTWVTDGMPSLYVANPHLGRIASGFHGAFSWTAAVEGRKPGAWAQFNRVDFGKNASPSIYARAQGQGRITVRLDDKDGAVVAESDISSDTFTTLDLPLKEKVRGIHTVVVVFTPDDGKTVLLRQLSMQNIQ